MGHVQCVADYGLHRMDCQDDYKKTGSPVSSRGRSSGWVGLSSGAIMPCNRCARLKRYHALFELLIKD